MGQKMTLIARLGFLLTALAGSLSAQRGDKAGEDQPAISPDIRVPAAPVLDPTAALASMRLAPGLRMELVAAEPLVQDPICMTFDASGRIWVIEMRSFMPNVDGEGEQAPTSRVVVLEDDDGDGVMDRSRVFLEGLVLPRALALVDDGLLLIEPPNLWFHRDSDGDGRADQKELVTSGFDAGLDNVEHAANSLLFGLDNWIYMANHPLRIKRLRDGSWLQEPILSGGQWGLSKDDKGRLFFNYNSDFLRSNLYPAHYGGRHPHQGRPFGLNQQVIKNQAVWPSRVTPGINRGYQDGMLRDGVLTRTTAVCGPVIYRGDALPNGFRGNAFVCEPAGNLVRRLVLDEQPGRITGKNPYEKSEFLSSSDERFRPVNLYNGPDGALYLVDMYRGIIQHKNFVTTFLRRQIIERGLEAPLGLGRIWRILPAGEERQEPQNLSRLSDTELASLLAADNGWTRDQAQRLLVDRDSPQVAHILRSKLLAEAPAVGRVHALWTLEGMNRLRRSDVFRALHDESQQVQATGIRLAEPFLEARPEPLLWVLIDQLAAQKDPEVLLQLTLSLGELSSESALIRLARIAELQSEDPILRQAALSGSYERELAFIQQLTSDADSPGKRAVLRQLSRLLTAGRSSNRLEQLLELIAATPETWRRRAMLQGMVDSLPRQDSRAGFLKLSRSPAALGSLSRETELQTLLAELLPAIAIQPESADSQEDEQLEGAQLQSFRQGSRLYPVHCAVCHQVDGRGMDGLAPPLRDSDWVLGEPERSIRIVLHGLVGPVRVADKEYDMSMPGHAGLGDDEIAAILTYLRRVWNHRATPVSASRVESVRSATAERETQWTAEELLRIR